MSLSYGEKYVHSEVAHLCLCHKQVWRTYWAVRSPFCVTRTPVYSCSYCPISQGGGNPLAVSYISTHCSVLSGHWAPWTPKFSGSPLKLTGSSFESTPLDSPFSPSLSIRFTQSCLVRTVPSSTESHVLGDLTQAHVSNATRICDPSSDSFSGHSSSTGHLLGKYAASLIRVPQRNMQRHPVP